MKLIERSRDERFPVSRLRSIHLKLIDFTVSLDSARFTILKHIDPSADGRDALDSQFSGLGVVLKKY